MGLNKLRWVQYHERLVSGHKGEYGLHAALVRAVRAERHPRATPGKPKKPVQKGLFD